MNTSDTTCVCCGTPYGSFELCPECGKYVMVYHTIPHRMQEHGYKPDFNEWYRFQKWTYAYWKERDSRK